MMRDMASQSSFSANYMRLQWIKAMSQGIVEPIHVLILVVSSKWSQSVRRQLQKVAAHPPIRFI